MCSSRTHLLDESHLDVTGQRLRVLHRLDKTKPPLLVFNGIGATADLLRPLLEQIPGPVVAYDLPGIGLSPVGRAPQRMREHAVTALRLLDLLNVERCHVMGISWGGALAQQFTRQYPRRVEKLILAATSTGQLMLPPKLSVVLRMATPLRYFSPRFLHRVAGDIYGGDFRHDSAKAAGILGRMSPPSLRGYLGQVYALAGWTSLFWLHRLETPTLVLAGRDDPIVPLANARMLATRMPDASLQVYNCGHLFVLTRLDQVVADIARFLYPPG